jgi:hypothetical protein
MPSVVDPVVRSFVEAVNHEGVATTTDTVGGLFLRLINRVGVLERKVEAQSSQIAKIDKLARAKPAPVAALAPVMTGVDVATGAPVRILPRRPRGRPAGSRDTYKRTSRARHHNLEAEVSSNLIDGDWDHLGVG